MVRPVSEGMLPGIPARRLRQPRKLTCQNWLSVAENPVTTVGRLTFMGSVVVAVFRYGPPACSTQWTLVASFGSAAVKSPFASVTAVATGEPPLVPT